MPTLLHQMIDESADRFPDAPAFRFRDRDLSYAELAERSDRIAAVLGEHGVQRGDRVGLLLHKSLETAAALYGTMKAGAVYVPLDPTAPVQRTVSVMTASSVSALITHPPKAQAAGDVIARFGAERLACVLGLDDAPSAAPPCIAWPEIEKAATMRRRAKLLDDDIAYIIFTSGSTGTPKGITHSHRSGLSYAQTAARLYDVSATSRLSNHSPLHFDMSTFDYFCGPLRGACTVIIPEGYTKLPASLSKLIQDEQLTHWYSVPFALRQLLEHGALDKRDLTSLRWVLFGGEPFPARPLRELVRRLPNARFCNVYGPAEVNQCTHHEVRPRDLQDDRPPPIGQLWDAAEGLVVDDTGREVEPGDLGELLVRSATMMRGYWGRPDLNESAYHVRSSAGDVTQVFYRTGDLVCRDKDGQLRFVARKDHQAKVRGYRVELDEVEAVMTAHPLVVDAAAIVMPGQDGYSAIIAAVTLKGRAETSTIEGVRAAIAERLPDYAVPSRIAVIDTFPRTTSQKIDRKALAGELNRRFSEEGSEDAR